MAAELVLRLTGGANNTDPAKSLGNETSVWPVALNDLFPDVSAADRESGRIDYRALDLLNIGDQGAHGIRAWTGDAGVLTLAVTGVVDVASKDGRSPPWDHGHFVSFAGYSKSLPLEVNDLAQDGAARLWLCRTIPPGGPFGPMSETLFLEYV